MLFEASISNSSKELHPEDDGYNIRLKIKEKDSSLAWPDPHLMKDGRDLQSPRDITKPVM